MKYYTDEKEQLNDTLRAAEKQGGWASYAVYMLGDANTGDTALDEAITDLYIANEKVHRIANRLALDNDLDFFSES